MHVCIHPGISTLPRAVVEQGYHTCQCLHMHLLDDVWDVDTSSPDISGNLTMKIENESGEPVTQLAADCHESVEHAAGSNPDTGRMIYLVKWTALPYSACTWEYFESIHDHAAIDRFNALNDLSISLACPASSLPTTDSSTQVGVVESSDAWKRWEKERPTADSWQALQKSPRFKNDNVLRGWQVEGCNWLLFNWYQRRGCILADEMGLGKTVQTVSLVHAMASKYSRGPYLVVAPLSTMGHWKREFEAWSDLNTIVVQGTKEDRDIARMYEWHYWDRVRSFVHLCRHTF